MSNEEYSWSIVNQLGGTIVVRSEVGIGTDVKVLVPVEKAEPPNDEDLASEDTVDTTDVRIAAEKAMRLLRNRATGKLVSFDLNQLTPSKSYAWDSIQRYCSEWYGFDIHKSDGTPKTGDLLIINERPDFPEPCTCQRILVINDAMGYPSVKRRDRLHFVAHISHPIGPYRLARSILALLDQMSCESHQKDVTTQTPLASPNVPIGNEIGEYCFLPLQEPEPRNGVNKMFVSTDQTAREEFAQSLEKLEKLQLHEVPAPLHPQPLAIPTTTPQIPERKSSIQPQPQPQVQPQTSQPEATEAKLAPEKTSLRILAVDDNALNLQLIDRYLQKRKTDTIVNASDGIEAVAAVRASDNGFDVIFMDISMPNMDGFEATRLIRGWEGEYSKRLGVASPEQNGNQGINNRMKDWKRAYVVAMTGLGSQKARDEADRSGFDDFMTKPVKLPKVGELLKMLSCEKAARLEGKGE